MSDSGIRISTKYFDQDGVRTVAEYLHQKYGHLITCEVCVKVEGELKAYNKDEGGKAASDGSKRRQWRCRNSVAVRKKTGATCPIKSCSGYIQRALVTIGNELVEAARQKILLQVESELGSVKQITLPFRRASAPTVITSPARSQPSPPPSPVAKASEEPAHPPSKGEAKYHLWDWIHRFPDESEKLSAILHNQRLIVHHLQDCLYGKHAVPYVRSDCPPLAPKSANLIGKKRDRPKEDEAVDDQLLEIADSQDAEASPPFKRAKFRFPRAFPSNADE